MNIKYSTTFKRQYKKAPKKIQEKVKERISLFVQNPTSQLLNNHARKGKFQGCRSINISRDCWAIYSIRINLNSEQEYYFELVGTHSQLYGWISWIESLLKQNTFLKTSCSVEKSTQDASIHKFWNRPRFLPAINTFIPRIYQI